MTVLHEDRSSANVEGERIGWTEISDLEVMPLVTKPILMQESLIMEVPTPILALVHHQWAQVSKLPGDALAEGNFWID